MAATKITSRVLADDAVVRATLGDDAIGTAEIADDAVTGALIADDVALAGNPTTTTQSLGNSSTRLATTAFVQAAVDADINALIDSAPGTMNTLDEIAAALNDDPTFTTTVNNAIALKAPLANPTFTGNATFDSPTLYVDGSNNRVGIGNTAPDVLLEVAGAHTSSIGMLHIDSSDHAFISLDAASSSHDKGIYFQEAGTATVIIDHDGSANLLRIHDGSNTHMVIQDDGKVGIGTTSPGTALEVASSGATEITISGGDTSYTNAGLVLEATNSTSYRGLGVFMHDAGGDHEWYAGTPYAASDQYQIGRQGTAAHAVSTAQTSLAFLTVKNDGKVGIGTASPADRLHVALDSSTTNDTVDVVRIEATSSGTPAVGLGPVIDFRADRVNGGPDSVGRIGFVADTMTSTTVNGAFVAETAIDGTYSERMRITSAGDVLIGQTSQTGYTFAEKLVVGDGDANDGITIQSGSTHQGNLAFNHSDGTTAHGRILYQHNTNYMAFMTNNDEKIRFTTDGAIGIGGANYGTSGQAIVSGGSGAAVSWGSAGISTGKAIAMAIVFG